MSGIDQRCDREQHGQRTLARRKSETADGQAQSVETAEQARATPSSPAATVRSSSPIWSARSRSPRRSANALQSEPRRPRLSLHRRPRRRQDQHGPHPGQGLNCEKGPTPTPCDQCDICQAIAAGEDIDVLEIDGASNNGVDEVRELRSNVQYRPSRVALQDLHHRRSPHALQGGLQRPAQDAGRAAAARQVHLRHHRSAERSRSRSCRAASASTSPASARRESWNGSRRSSPAKA